MGPPSRKTRAKPVSGTRRLSTISEKEPEKLDTDPSSHGPLGGSEWGGSSFSTSSDKFKNSSSRFSSADSYQPDSAGNVQHIWRTTADVMMHRGLELKS